MNDAVVDVILLDVPVTLWAKSRAHRQNVVTELMSRREEDEFAASLVDMLSRVREEYATVAETADAELSAASARRLETVDVAYPVPRRAAADLAALVEALNKTDAYVRKIGRKDLVTPKDCKTFTAWYFGEIAKQLDGGFPTAWPASK